MLKPTLSVGAKDEIRTRDPDLGKVVLYQLSYFRLTECKYTAIKLIFSNNGDTFFEKKYSNKISISKSWLSTYKLKDEALFLITIFILHPFILPKIYLLSKSSNKNFWRVLW